MQRRYSLAMNWVHGLVSVEDSVAAVQPASGERLRDTFLADIGPLTLGLIRARGNSLRFGPIELLRFGQPKITKTSVEWPVEGGLLARSAGGRWRIGTDDGRLVASLHDYRPTLPRPLYVLTQLQAHHFLTRLYLLRVRGREPSPGVRVSAAERRRSATVDFAFCVTLTRLFGRPPRLRTFLGIAAGYHLACWSITGRTLGGMVTHQRVVAIDGSRLTLTQSTLRLAALPLSWILRRPMHDELAGTDVIQT
jgi:RDD family protein